MPEWSVKLCTDSWPLLYTSVRRTVFVRIIYCVSRYVKTTRLEFIVCEQRRVICIMLRVNDITRNKLYFFSNAGITINLRYKAGDGRGTV